MCLIVNWEIWWKYVYLSEALPYHTFSFSDVEFLFVNSSWWKIWLPDCKWMMIEGLMSAFLPSPPSCVVIPFCIATPRRQVSNPRQGMMLYRGTSPGLLPGPGVDFLGCIEGYFFQCRASWLLEVRAGKWPFWLQCTFMKCTCILFLVFYVSFTL